MGKLQNNQTGFSAIEAVLILVIVGIVGFVGWYVLNAQKNTDKYLSVTNTTAVAPKQKTETPKAPEAPGGAVPADMLSYTSTLGGFNIHYPKTWTIVGYASPSSTTQIPAAQMGGSETSFLITSSNAASNSFGAWFTIGDSPSDTSSMNSAFTQVPYAQGSVIKTLKNGISIWQASQTITTNGHSNPDTCTPFETVSNNAFGYKLANGKYVDATMSFCYAQGETTTNNYDQQASSTELQQAIAIVSSLTQY